MYYNKLNKSTFKHYGGAFGEKATSTNVSAYGAAAKNRRILNQYGQQGWELQYVWSAWHYFKRNQRLI